MRRNWLVFKRLESGHTQLSLAEETGLNNDTISRIERGEVTPKLETASKLAKALNFDVNMFNLKDDETA